MKTIKFVILSLLICNSGFLFAGDNGLEAPCAPPPPDFAAPQTPAPAYDSPPAYDAPAYLPPASLAPAAPPPAYSDEDALASVVRHNEKLRAEIQNLNDQVAAAQASCNEAVANSRSEDQQNLAAALKNLARVKAELDKTHATLRAEHAELRTAKERARNHYSTLHEMYQTQYRQNQSCERTIQRLGNEIADLNWRLGRAQGEKDNVKQEHQKAVRETEVLRDMPDKKGWADHKLKVANSGYQKTLNTILHQLDNRQKEEHEANAVNASVKKEQNQLNTTKQKQEAEAHKKGMKKVVFVVPTKATLNLYELFSKQASYQDGSDAFNNCTAGIDAAISKNSTAGANQASLCQGVYEYSVHNQNDARTGRVVNAYLAQAQKNHKAILIGAPILGTILGALILRFK